ncbi:ABC transporter substrate-binding protein [Cupriavidus basilensis]|uniref:ABC transporter substrate-binding protein n=1 Tax=Cupriavidus basilensis TaxID=68895 RepID=A0A0C4YB76_9BURK|nr:ABC transporter substrate-binding protein [Cupriavidus basilensis]AJG19484.1 ABC transporter substrate-binding protein [Cupriavidus basilensis]
MLSRTLLPLFIAGAACLTPSPAKAADPALLRVGLMTVKTGVAAGIGSQMQEGFEYLLSERGGRLAGRPIQLIVADTAASPATAKAKFLQLTERDHVDVVVGPLAAFEAVAIRDDVVRARVPVILSSAAAEDLTQRKADPWMVRSSSSSAQAMHPFGDYAARVLKYKRIAVVAEDLAFSHEAVAGFQRTFEEAGGRITQRLWAPFNSSDFATVIAQIKPDVDAVFINFSGANATRFLKQYNEYGLKQKLPLLAGMNTVDESLLDSLGNEALGITSAGWYSAAIDTADNARYVAGFRKRYKSTPGFYATGGYSAALLLEQALQATGGMPADGKALADALHAVKIDRSPRGPLKLDRFGNPVVTVYVRKVTRVNDRLVNSVVMSYPDVSQFWTYEPKTFLASPVYSREFPPARNLE